MSYGHQPVLLQEVIDGLAIQTDGLYVDATFGRGGHARAILQKLGENGRLLALDKDLAAVAAAEQGEFADDPRFSIVHASFIQLQAVLEQRGYLGAVNGILFDLGVSSPQLDDPERGFSFHRDGPLDMRMNTQQGMDAASWLNQAEEKDIADVLFRYGEERHSRRIARAIVAARVETPLTRTLQLAKIIADANPSHERHKHPATRSFQAIRIFVNNELNELTELLTHCVAALTVGGRLCAISFHSLEDRIVKRFIQQAARGDDYPPDLPIKFSELRPTLRKVGKLIQPDSQQIAQNSRARSARLRIAEKIA